MNMQLADYIALQSQGVRISEPGAVRRGGAGPADARAFVIDGHPLMIPTLSSAAQHSDYELSPEADGWRLTRGGTALCHARSVARPAFYDLATADGIPYSKIALLHGRDCLASTVIQECVRYNSLRTRCRFCAIGASLDREATLHTKTPAQLAEVALAAQRLDNVRHVTLTAGTTHNPDDGAMYLGRCAQAIKQATGLPVEIQFEPLRDRSLYARLKAMGVDDVGLHVESFDERVRRRMTPGKAEVGLERYFEAFELAVAVFGRNKVSTYVILGLGEDEAASLEGCRRAAALGVYPVVVPLRPLLDSCLAKAKPVDPLYLARMYRAVGAMLEDQGLSADASTAGCVRCRACSLLQFIEAGPRQTPCATATACRTEPAGPAASPPHVELRVAATPEELEEYRRVRHEVFVAEQGVFEDSDEDAHDRDAVPIIATVDGRVAGAVRCYRQRGRVWYGGRLAVRPEFRNGLNLGALLVRKAVESMAARGDVGRFLATVQIQNVRFFQRLGWRKLGRVFLFHGRRHQTMEMDLTNPEGQHR